MGHYDECRPGYCGSCGAAPGNLVNGVCPFCKPKTKRTSDFVRITEAIKETEKVAVEWHEVNKRFLMVDPVTEQIYATVTVMDDGTAYYKGIAYLTKKGAKKAAEQEYKCQKLSTLK